MLPEILIKSIAAVLSALAGAGVLFLIKLNHKKLCALISFSAGALFAAAAFTLVPESYSSLSVFELVISLASGYLLFYLISKYYSHVCPACSASHFDEQTTKKFSEIVLTLLTALSLHSLLDGVALATGDASGHGHSDSVFAAITTHKFPEGLALAALMFSSNYSKKRILISVTLVESITIVGAILGLYLFQSGISPSFMAAVMAHIAGGFIYLALHAVMGEMLRNHKNLVIASFSLGLMIILGVNILFG
jgi:zinc transporter ZupT